MSMSAIVLAFFGNEHTSLSVCKATPFLLSDQLTEFSKQFYQFVDSCAHVVCAKLT